VREAGTDGKFGADAGLAAAVHEHELAAAALGTPREDLPPTPDCLRGSEALSGRRGRGAVPALRLKSPGAASGRLATSRRTPERYVSTARAGPILRSRASHQVAVLAERGVP
jgi:hypothetical protein